MKISKVGRHIFPTKIIMYINQSQEKDSCFKDYIINMFKEEIQRKNQLINELLERQEMLE